MSHEAEDEDYITLKDGTTICIKPKPLYPSREEEIESKAKGPSVDGEKSTSQHKRKYEVRPSAALI